MWVLVSVIVFSVAVDGCTAGSAFLEVIRLVHEMRWLWVVYLGLCGLMDE